MTGKDGVEKRKQYRVYTRIPVVCELLDPETKAIRNKTAITRDVSPEGIHFELDELLPLKAEINVKFQLPHAETLISATIRVVRVETVSHGFAVGAEFCRISPTDKEQIRLLTDRLNINRLLDMAVVKGASDLHLLAEQTPFFRINGDLQPIVGQVLHADEIPQMVFSMMSHEQVDAFERDKELDFGIQYDLATRFRVNVHQQRGYVEATIRLIESKSFSFEDLHIPEAVKELARHKDGLILITGPTGSGKTTTIAAMVGLINQERKVVIITLERPIEYVHKNDKSIIKQREVGVDTNSFSVALKSSLRQDPNVIVIGEMDDAETVRTSIVAAEAGYLVIATFHAPDTIQAVDRLVSMFPAENRKQMLAQLSNCLRGVVAQLLLPRKDKKGRILASEVLMANDAVKRIIRKDELFQLTNVMQTGSGHHMQLMSDVIRHLLEQNLIDTETAIFHSQELSKFASGTSM